MRIFKVALTPVMAYPAAMTAVLFVGTTVMKRASTVDDRRLKSDKVRAAAHS